MAKKRRTAKAPELIRWYRGADVPMTVIHRFAREVAERFRPEKVILFGSYAYGTPHADSDVDVLVVMPARNQLDQAFKIHWTIRPPFPLAHHRPHAEEHAGASGGRRVVSHGGRVEGQSAL